MSGSRATEATRRSPADAVGGMPSADERDFEDADRGFVGRSGTRQITATDGRVVWDLDAYAFMEGDAPETVHPSLWRQGRLLIKDGLFEVVPGIYQLRGFDLSVMSVIEGDSGVVVVDPLVSKETAAAAFALYTEHRGVRPVVAVIYSHSHIDHFGGVKGVVSEDDVRSGRTQIIAPHGFMEHAASENVFAGTAMARRAGYMYGAALEKGPAGQVGTGLGQTVSTGEATLIPPTVHVTETGQTLTVDGVRIVFQVTPGTEAPAEMNFYLPDHRALCTAENTSHTLHNVLTIRGAQVRDARAWADYLTQTISLWGDELDVVFASHHWPTWGRAQGVEFLGLQRDLYSYLHDQTLRLLNQGYVGPEIAEMLRMPPALEAVWSTRGYYGSVSHNVKAVYQRYMGWYDGNPAHLWAHPPVAAAQRYITAMGGVDAAVGIARQAFDEGDYRWAVEVLNHVLFADEDHIPARALQADALEQLGFGAENGTWRNAFLSGAHELRHGRFGTPTTAAAPDIMAALTVEQVFAGIGVRIDGPRAWDEHIVLSWVLTDEERTHVLEVRNGALNQRVADAPAPGSTTFTLTRPVLISLLTGARELPAALAEGSVSVDGDPADLGRLVDLLAPVDPDFAIVTA
ncbi:MBL fold metallo-hydrolase [Streptomyces fradiae ATCC 10745 = DSM 40063]|uniref:Linear primary-alkylsulfatase n=2 Tax=Streptomyces fradiae ATCC 10745 = DSM 40063 TaxID=1319510 RepID=A0A1Y2NQI8_STRFR|nr:Metallo-beta-lactamase superfamily protein [Streptomyces fradiae ATCC 10745 = DSM 40063]QEV14089.1 MBL fold metallo-hydrolase [Streptomyces fradiae ATCC 10745 = DSM 40063]